MIKIIVYSRTGVELRRLDVPGSIGIQSIGADDVGGLPGSPSANLIFAQYADGSALGFANKTRIVLMAGDTPDSGEIRFFNEVGVPQSPEIGGSSMSTVQYSLPSNGTVEISTDGSGDLKRGPVEVFSDQGAGSLIRGAEVFELLGHSVSVPNSPPQKSHRLYVNFNSEERTAIAAYNPDSSRSVTLHLALISEDGQERATATLELAAREQKAVFLDEPAVLADVLSGNFRGALSVTSDNLPVCLLSLIQKTANGALIVVGLD